MLKYRRRRRFRIVKRKFKSRRVKLRAAKRGVFLNHKRTRDYTEVKYADNALQNKGLPTEFVTSSAARAEAVLFSQPLEIIAAGVGRNQRIGNKIHVKKISIWARLATCNFSDGAGSIYAVNSALARIFCISTRPGGSPYTTISDVFGNSGMLDRMLVPLNRRTYTVHYDKVFKIESGYPNSPTATYAGAQRYVRINIPVNRTVEYTDTGVVKNDYDNFTFYGFGTPNAVGPVAGGAPSAVCSNFFLRIYYTDV